MFETIDDTQLESITGGFNWQGIVQGALQGLGTQGGIKEKLKGAGKGALQGLIGAFGGGGGPQAGGGE